MKELSKTVEEINLGKINLKLAYAFENNIENKNIIVINEDNENYYAVIPEEENIDKDYMKFLYNKNFILNKTSDREFKELKSRIFSKDDRSLEEKIICRAIERNASDIHFEPQENWVNVRYRINGNLVNEMELEKDKYAEIVSKIKIIGKMDIAEKRKPQDGNAEIKNNGKRYDLRISIIPVIYGEKIVIRLLYSEQFNYTLESLGFSEEKYKIIKQIMAVKNGIVIVAGPTGAGKSSTLYAILKEIDAKKNNITTLEDPVEVKMPNVNQMNVNSKCGVTFAAGLKSILRQDPDVIMVGEIRDEETAEIAVNASITGHKVYSTIHCKSPAEVFMRLENMGVKPYLIKEGLAGVISQRLIKVLCPECKILDEKNSDKCKKIYMKKGCPCCNYTGYSGRKVVSAVCAVTSDADLSNSSMKDDLDRMLSDGIISLEDYKDFIEGERLA